MTGAQYTEYLHTSRKPARELPHETEHDAPNEAATMSSYGPREKIPVVSRSKSESSRIHDKPTITTYRNAQTQTSATYTAGLSDDYKTKSSRSEDAIGVSGKSSEQRLCFIDYAEQLRQQQHFQDKRNHLLQRKRLLQKIITLSARLHRVSAWIGDGLIEILEQPDTAGFVRLHQHIQNLIELSYSQWDHDLHSLDRLGKITTKIGQNSSQEDVLSKLSNESRANLIELLSRLRSDPRFLIARFRALAPSQIVSLRSSPRFRRVPEPGELEYGPFITPRARLSSQRIQAYSKSLEEYALSLERSNPLSFLIFNLYGTDQSPTDAENRLRLSTWSTVCAELMVKSRHTFNALISHLLDSFASMYEWQSKNNIEMFLMDILQRGAFLLDDSGYLINPGSGARSSRIDPLQTSQALEFFDSAVVELFVILSKIDSGFPPGALQLCSAIIHKLPLVEQQMEFRGFFFSKWFIEQFLETVLSYPENEGMLLKFHVSNSARHKILRQLWYHVRDRVHDVYSEYPNREVDPIFRVCVETIVGSMGATESKNPYTEMTARAPIGSHIEGSFMISVSEVIQVLEALSPQAIHNTRSDHYTFNSGAVYGQYTQVSSRFDRLKNDLISLSEPGLSAQEVHPCQERWLQFSIDKTGRPMVIPTVLVSTTNDIQADQNSLDQAQEGVLRLLQDRKIDWMTLNGAIYKMDLRRSPRLEALFRAMEVQTEVNVDPMSYRFWVGALDSLYDRYPRSILVGDDSAVLQEMYQNSVTIQMNNKIHCIDLEAEMSLMEDMCLKFKATIQECMERFESLRLKIWYAADVVLSKHYDDAKNIAKALNNMAAPTSRYIRSSSSSFYGRPMSTTSSLFDQPLEDTMNMIKAPKLHGGPKKLADKQIDLTKSWLRQSNTENFCKGEERIHRFCMEVYTVSRSLVGETLSESPVLWASELFSRERSLFDIRAYSVTSAPASTRPASIMSDSMSTSYRAPRQLLRSAESLRMALLEDRRSIGSSGISRDSLPPKLASSIGSLSRAHSATTAESISSVFSPLPANTRSFTSASIHSRSASIFNDPGLTRFTDTARAKTKFLDKVRQVLLCLLLSDLGCPVWSLGSETDAMLGSVCDDEGVNNRLKQRVRAEMLARDPMISKQEQRDGQLRMRSNSTSGSLETAPIPPEIEPIDDNDQQDQQEKEAEYDRLTSLAALLRRLSQQIDPVEKLAIVGQFYNLSLTTLKARSLSHDVDEKQRIRQSHLRIGRRSLDELKPSLQKPQQSPSKAERASRVKSISPQDVIQHLKADLTQLQFKTLFRDLQYISAFVPAEQTDNTLAGKALLQLGLAALAYKDELCRSMVDVADQALSQQSESGAKAGPGARGQIVTPNIIELWLFAAREGNAVAQRELASLYLSRPDLLPIISAPLFKPSDIFRAEMLWHDDHHHHSNVNNSNNNNSQALCLALHWMQQASNNGDKLAKQKLEERSERNSIQ